MIELYKKLVLVVEQINLIFIDSYKIVVVDANNKVISINFTTFKVVSC